MFQPRQTRLAGGSDAVPGAVLTDRESGGTVELPVLEGTMGPPVIDIRALYAGTGKFSYDPGYTATGSCKSRITYIDGEEGLLLHRGYPIAELAEQSDFLEVAYLLLRGELPNAAEKDAFVSTITKHTMVHEQINYLYRGFRRDSHPMAVMIGVVGALAAFYHDTTDIDDPNQRMIASHRLIAKMPTFAAMAFKYSIGQPFVYPRNDLTYAENFLHMMFAVPCEGLPDQPDPRARHGPAADSARGPRAERLDVDRAPRRPPPAPTPTPASRPALRRCGALPTAAPTRPCSRCWKRSARSTRFRASSPGPKTRTTPSASWASATGSTRTTTRRATVMRETCHEVLDDLGISDELLKIAMELERIALEDEYFVDRKLYPNVDFYSGLILQALGIPTHLFTVIFALARTVGWVAQWNEMIADPEQKIGRPRQLYTGPAQRSFLPLRERI